MIEQGCIRVINPGVRNPVVRDAIFREILGRIGVKTQQLTVYGSFAANIRRAKCGYEYHTTAIYRAADHRPYLRCCQWVKLAGKLPIYLQRRPDLNQASPICTRTAPTL